MKVILTIIIVILILRILARYNMQRMQDHVREQQRIHHEQQQRQNQPDITVTKKPKKDEGDYIDYEEVK